MSNNQSSQIVRQAKLFSWYASLGVSLIGWLVTLGWLLSIPALSGVVSGGVTMKFNTALAFIVASGALLLLRKGSSRAGRLAQIAAALVALVGILTLAEYLFGWNLRIDQWLVMDSASPVYPGRMSLPSALNLALLGSALLLQARSNYDRLAQSLILIAGGIASLTLIGYVYNIESLYRFGPYAAIALHTALTFLLLCLAMLFAQPDRGFMSIFSSDSAGGLIARWILPTIIVVPMLIGWLVWRGYQAHLYSTGTDLTLFTLFNISVFGLIAGRVSYSLHRIDVQRQTVTQALRAEERFRTLLESAPDAIIIVNASGEITLANMQAEKLFGYGRSELIGQSVEMLIPKSLRPYHLKHRADYEVSPQARGMGVGLDLHGLHKNGNEFPVEISLSPIEMDGEILISSAIRDITERKQAEAQKLEIELQREKVVLLKRFISDASHDLRTPLTSMNTSLYLLRKVSDTEKQLQYVGNLEEQTGQIQKIIDGLLTLSRLDMGASEFRFVPANLNELVKGVCDQQQSLAAHKEQQLTYRLDDSLPVMLIDPQELSLALWHLVVNAVTYTPERGRIMVSTQQEGDEAIIQVHDTGMGISTQELTHVFERFYRVDQSRNMNVGGSGLGLAIAQRIVDIHKGRIEVESTLEQGSTFRIILPISDDTPLSS